MSRALFIASLMLAAGVPVTHAAPITGGGPGGVGTTDGLSSLGLWLRADLGVFSDVAGTTTAVDGGAVANWTDQSGRGNTVTQSTVANQPTFTAVGTGNGQPTIDFSPALEYLATNTSLAGGMSGRSVFIVNEANTNGNVGVLTLSDDGSGSGSRYIITAETGVRVSGGNRIFDTGLPSAPNILAVRNPVNGFTSDIEAFIDGSSLNEASLGNTQLDINDTELLVGAHTNSSDFSGTIGEMAVYETELNDAQRIVIENALASKYGITTLAADLYSGEATGHDLGVTGVAGIDPGSGLQTHLSGGTEGFGIETTSLLDGESIFGGHNDGGTGATNAGLNNPLDKRLERTWFIDDRAAADIQLSIDLSDAGIDPSLAGVLNRLALSTDGGSTFQTLDILPDSIVGDRFTFTLTDAQLQSAIYTLSTSVPEPSSGLLLVGALSAVVRSHRRRGSSGRRRARAGL